MGRDRNHTLCFCSKPSKRREEGRQEGTSIARLAHEIEAVGKERSTEAVRREPEGQASQPQSHSHRVVPQKPSEPANGDAIFASRGRALGALLASVTPNSSGSGPVLSFVDS